MAEITPTKTIAKKKNGLLPPSKTVRGDEGTKSTKASAERREEDARRRIYQSLLLNAWRQRRTQVATLSDSREALETEVKNLNLQIKALHDLRNAESEKRREAAHDVQFLKNKLSEALKTIENLSQEKTAEEKKALELQDMLEQCRVYVQNTKNNLTTTTITLRSFEDQLESERKKIKNLRNEKNTLLQQIACMKNEIEHLHKKSDEFRSLLLSVQLDLQNAIVEKTCEMEKMELIEKLNNETTINKECQEKVNELMEIKQELQIKLNDLIEKIDSNNEIREKTEEENHMLRVSLMDVTESLMIEQNRPWWENAKQLALAPLDSIKSLAHIMLPALPNSLSESSLSNNSDTS